MSHLYNYFSNSNYPIHITDNTRKVANLTFCKDGVMWETLSIKQFFNAIPTDTPYNIVDIGAQVGLYSLFAKFLPKSTFYSFEPFPTTFEELNNNIKLNNICNVKTFNMAISDKEGDVVLNTCITHNGLHTLGKNPLRFNDIMQINVKSTTIDTFFVDIPIHFIKIDTEGYEYYILKGAINSIKKYKPIIQLEWNITNMKQCNVTETMMNDLINKIGYRKITSVEEEILIGPL